MSTKLIDLIQRHDGQSVSYNGEMCVLYIDKYRKNNELWISLNNIDTGTIVMYGEDDLSEATQDKNIWIIGGNILNLLDDSHTYKVTVEATVRKDIVVEAETEQEATVKAHEQFTVANETDVDESYDEQTISIQKVISKPNP